MNTEDNSIVQSMIGKYARSFMSKQDISDLIFVCEHTAWDTQEPRGVSWDQQEKYNKGMIVAKKLLKAITTNT